MTERPHLSSARFLVQAPALCMAWPLGVRRSGGSGCAVQRVPPCTRVSQRTTSQRSATHRTRSHAPPPRRTGAATPLRPRSAAGRSGVGVPGRRPVGAGRLVEAVEPHQGRPVRRRPELQAGGRRPRARRGRGRPFGAIAKAASEAGRGAVACMRVSLRRLGVARAERRATAVRSADESTEKENRRRLGADWNACRCEGESFSGKSCKEQTR